MKTRSITNVPWMVAGAMLAFSLGATAQNSSYDADAIPVPGTGSSNSAFGVQTLNNNNNGSNNCAVGFYALNQNKDGYQNNAIGVAALYSNTNGTDNCAHGVKCLASNQDGSWNTAMGTAALASNDGYGNTGIGYYALVANQQGKYNSSMGYQSMQTNQNGACNTNLGSFADVASANLTNATAIGCGAIALNSDELWLGDANTKVWTVNSYNVSDGRFKKNISTDNVKGLDFINQLRPVTYNFDAKAFTEFQTKEMPADKRKNYLEKDFSKTTNEVQTGFIAQEVEEAAKKAGYDFSGVHKPENANDAYGVSYYQFVVPLVKAVQEQQQMISEQKQLIVMQQLANEKMQRQLDEQQQAINTLLGKTGATSLNQNATSGSSFAMEQNEPNPFTRETVVKYTLPEQVNSAYIVVYDLSGKQITKFDISQKGSSSMVISSDKLSSGIYIYSIVADGKVVDSKRMIVADK